MTLGYEVVSSGSEQRIEKDSFNLHGNFPIQ